ncbi:DUF934 domain-containing protein [Polynucleobacter sp. MG-5-Ahmo-C2]|uniref:DUF934 domain-containing protein n=1 Tax=Polynucleobacter sp. MG-5-Ahmo-C2 TaxID=2081051 RepID=UPI001BFD2DD1|nr:DUF934 domain-containing protein [Polynucleobacter sp. MG-5-Ahmo-C2]QWD98852.1 DUF934 domain-containing protein [Polynucleobacter sp. MG-5-Ahmo-C2]
MSNSNPTKLIQSHAQVLLFPREGKPFLAPNEWQVWDVQDESGLPAEYANSKVLVPFTWWRSQLDSRHEGSDVLTKAKKGQIGVWFAADDDILQHAELIESGKQYWPLVAAYFPLFRDGRSFSTAALLRDRLGWDKEIRMIGDVLIDQLLQGARVGFDSFALRHDQNLDVALKQFDLFTVTTQNSWRGKRSLLAIS